MNTTRTCTTPRLPALGDLYTRHRNAVMRFAAALGATACEVEDVANQVFLVAASRLEAFRGESSPRTWLLGITRRIVSDLRRSSRRWREQLTDVLPETAVVEDDVEAQLELAQTRRRLQVAVERLKPAQRYAVVAFHYQERPMTEVACTSRVPLQTAYARLYSAHRALRVELS